jgi:hypothetical protein
MSLLATKSPFYATFKSLALLWLFITYGLFLDGSYVYSITDNAQLYANLSMLLVFPFVYWKVNKRTKEHLIAGVLIGFFGEYLFSVALGMYSYRLENVPHYIPFGHALVYAGVLYFSKAASIIKNRKKVEVFLSIFIFIYASVFLIFKSDVFGFVMTLATLLILRNKPRERLFYLTMYISVAYLEIVGTSFLCWEWPETAFDTFSFLPSHNPPSGISLFYFLLDLGCLWIYKQRHKIAWSRMKNSRKIKFKTSNFTN